MWTNTARAETSDKFVIEEETIEVGERAIANVFYKTTPIL